MTLRPRKGARTAAELRGRRAEYLSCWLLRAKGYQLVTRRYRCPVGEADLVVTKGKTLIFVEVKWRRTLDLALSSIQRKQRQRIEAAAKFYLAKNKKAYNKAVRFDVIALAPRRFPRHIKGAWRPTA